MTHWTIGAALVAALAVASPVFAGTLATAPFLVEADEVVVCRIANVSRKANVRDMHIGVAAFESVDLGDQGPGTTSVHSRRMPVAQSAWCVFHFRGSKRNLRASASVERDAGTLLVTAS